ncbi:MAG: hypothetical protein JOZ78_18905 [Chroococcidiopsidaceae cyanobacterium CP_BM_ER_R8_30]|nr:hypothetical protein [Chroococcidiopsidaceae cyanobacterium CP_BM_ER_R8_30]
MDFKSDFQPCQIVCLEHEGTCLYAEVIQVVISRQLCWVRPLLLGALSSDSNLVDELLPLTDLRSCADLLWPIASFRPALDTEVIPLLVTLLASPERNLAATGQLDVSPEAASTASLSKLNQFIHRVWQADKGAFCSGRHC